MCLSLPLLFSVILGCVSGLTSLSSSSSSIAHTHSLIASSVFTPCNNPWSPFPPLIPLSQDLSPALARHMKHRRMIIINPLLSDSLSQFIGCSNGCAPWEKLHGAPSVFVISLFLLSVRLSSVLSYLSSSWSSSIQHHTLSLSPTHCPFLSFIHSFLLATQSTTRHFPCRRIQLRTGEDKSQARI